MAGKGILREVGLRPLSNSYPLSNIWRINTKNMPV
jgi:hypothetical protein